MLRHDWLPGDLIGGGWSSGTWNIQLAINVHVVSNKFDSMLVGFGLSYHWVQFFAPLSTSLGNCSFTQIRDPLSLRGVRSLTNSLSLKKENLATIFRGEGGGVTVH